MGWFGRVGWKGKGTNVTAAVQDDAHDLPLLYLGELELRESLACVDVVLSSINHERSPFSLCVPDANTPHYS